MDIMKALKNHYRFKLGEKNLAIEQLFYCNMEQLDDIFKGLCAELNALQAKQSLLHPVKIPEELREKIDIVQTIFKSVLEEKRKKAQDDMMDSISKAFGGIK